VGVIAAEQWLILLVVVEMCCWFVVTRCIVDDVVRRKAAIGNNGGDHDSSIGAILCCHIRISQFSASKLTDMHAVMGAAVPSSVKMVTGVKGAGGGSEGSGLQGGSGRSCTHLISQSSGGRLRILCGRATRSTCFGCIKLGVLVDCIFIVGLIWYIVGYVHRRCICC